MKKLISCVIVGLIVSISSFGITSTFNFFNNVEANESAQVTNNGYGLQWIMEYGSSPWTDARFQGPQPIGDSDNDGRMSYSSVEEIVPYGL